MRKTMKIRSNSFGDGERIPEEFAFGRIDAGGGHVALSANRNPQLAWSGVPAEARSLALVCIDSDVPSVGDDINREGRTVPVDLPRTDFAHWLMIDIPPACTGIAAGACCDGITPRGKHAPPGPAGARQGRNDYTGWFASDPDMAGDYLGYDGPCPPWNDERLHRYRFRILALDVARLDLPDGFGWAGLQAALHGHVLAEAALTGTYSLNPAVR